MARGIKTHIAYIAAAIRIAAPVYDGNQFRIVGIAPGWSRREAALTTHSEGRSVTRVWALNRQLPKS